MIASRLLQSVEIFAGGGGMALGMRGSGFQHHAWLSGGRLLPGVLRVQCGT